jgi:hypothetical protein
MRWRSAPYVTKGRPELKETRTLSAGWRVPGSKGLVP